MQQNRRAGVFREALGYEGLAMLVCLLLGVAMVVNTQLGGEAMWYWYATVFHHGAKLYSGLHTPLQPLFLLLTDAWMTLFGRRFIVTEIPSVIQILGLSFGMFLILRESRWPSWQKAIVLLGAFVLTVGGHSYRFDDYHVMAEQFVIYALILLLWMARTEDVRRNLLLAGTLGVICGLAITTRVTDGVALLASSLICMPFLLRSKRIASIALMTGVAVVTILFVVHLTGDSFSAYISSTVFRAAASKGGTGSIFAAPFLTLRNTLIELVHIRKRLIFEIALVLGVCPAVYLYWRRGVRYIAAIQAVLVVLICLSSRVQLHDFATGTMIDVTVLAATTVMYVSAMVVAVLLLRRSLAGKREAEVWDAREVLIVVPLALWASYSAGAAGDPLMNYYGPVAALLLLVVVWQPFGKQREWANPTFVTLMALVALSGISEKIITPYAWQNYNTYPMFEHREWYHHPVYGEMYIDRDLLKLSISVCNDIGSVPGKNAPELLSIPYPFANLFCDTPPWHNYVQTFFDTSTRGTIEQLMHELNTAPPQYIVYQQQLGILGGAERLYNHGKPLAQRDLDTMIMAKLATGQWKLLEKSDYLAPSRPETWYDPQKNGWYIIQTHP
jgi:hypothetical protein